MWPGYGLRQIKWRILLYLRAQKLLMPSEALQRSGKERRDAVNSIRGNKRQNIQIP